MARVLVIGVATIDIVASLDTYPEENTKVRATYRDIRRGGNATNTAVVLSQLGHHVAWGGVLVDTPESAVIVADLARHHIDLRWCHRTRRGTPPTSYILLSNATASRTIIHYRDAPEFSFDDFARIDLSEFDWIHFEGRAVDETARMLEHLASRSPLTLRTSLEAETVRPGIEHLLPFCNVVFFSRQFARQQGATDAGTWLESIRGQFADRIAVCSAGENGAYALDRNGCLHHSPAFPPPRVVDTIGAGDTLHAALIDGNLRGLSVPDALTRACRIAGEKCGHSGLTVDIPN